MAGRLRRSARRPGADRRPVPAADRAAPPGRALLGAGEFAALEAAAYDLRFEHVAAGPLVRSSYHADEHIEQNRPGASPVAAASLTYRCTRTVVPAPRQHPDRALPGRHGRADHRERAFVYFFLQDGLLGLPDGGAGGDWPVSQYAAIPCEFTGESPCQTAPGGPRRSSPRSPACSCTAASCTRRQHAVPVDLRQYRRGLQGRCVHRLLPAGGPGRRRRAHHPHHPPERRDALMPAPRARSRGVLGGYLLLFPQARS